MAWGFPLKASMGPGRRRHSGSLFMRSWLQRQGLSYGFCSSSALLAEKAALKMWQIKVSWDQSKHRYALNSAIILSSFISLIYLGELSATDTQLSLEKWKHCVSPVLLWPHHSRTSDSGKPIAYPWPVADPPREFQVLIPKTDPAPWCLHLFIHSVSHLASVCWSPGHWTCSGEQSILLFMDLLVNTINKLFQTITVLSIMTLCYGRIKHVYYWGHRAHLLHSICGKVCNWYVTMICQILLNSTI